MLIQEPEVDGFSEVTSSVEGLLAAYVEADAERVADYFAEDAMVLTSDGSLPSEAILDALRYHFQNLTRQSFALEASGGRSLSSDQALTWWIGRTEGVDESGSVIFEGRVAVSIAWRQAGEGWEVTYVQEALWR